ncbi:hypothetical protein IQ07DRAFT_604340 [Pyrenochaeta sp. DS3sAY3a]|nr:hypothetical protein IQ07DRAFT_604340 [Pyrenochaeta sp. DS3sAY3a]
MEPAEATGMLGDGRCCETARDKLRRNNWDESGGRAEAGGRRSREARGGNLGAEQQAQCWWTWVGEKRTAAQNWQSRGIDVEIERMGAVQVQAGRGLGSKNDPVSASAAMGHEPWASALSVAAGQDARQPWALIRRGQRCEFSAGQAVADAPATKDACEQQPAVPTASLPSSALWEWPWPATVVSAGVPFPCIHGPTYRAHAPYMLQSRAVRSRDSPLIVPMFLAHMHTLTPDHHPPSWSS